MKPAPTDSAENVSITLKLTPALRNEIIRRSLVEDRNVSNFLTHWLERTFDEFDVVRQARVPPAAKMSSLYGVPVPARALEILHPPKRKPRPTPKPKKARKK